MPGLLAFHAHPDDEVIGTGGTMSRYVDAGEEVVVITATDGAEGEIHNYQDPDSLRPRLPEMRAEEIANALSILGVKHHQFLGYRDSGMMGTEANQHPDSFWVADFMEATGRLVRMIRRYRPEVMVIYDPFGGYGHPDHINVHRIGMAAFFGVGDHGRFPLEDGEQAWVPAKLYWTTWPRSRVQRMAEMWQASGELDGAEYELMQQSGTPDEEVSVWVDVVDYLDRKEQALRAHRSQIPEDWGFLRIPAEERPEMMGKEAYIRIFSRVNTQLPETDLFAGLR
jgi:LmbE family N-acetylglucosaminyl deacetylase